MTELYRTKGGARVHLSSCRYAVNGWEWRWAEGRLRADVRDECLRYGCYPCRKCWPLINPRGFVGDGAMA